MEIKVPTPVQSIAQIIYGFSSIMNGIGQLIRYSKTYEDLNDLADYFFLFSKISPDVIEEFKKLEEFKNKPPCRYKQATKEKKSFLKDLFNPRKNF